MAEGTTFVGLDVHQATIAMAVAESGGTAPRAVGVIPNEPGVLAKALRKLGEPGRLLVCYEAGPCGYTVYRQLTELGIPCVVVAPSLIPRRPGDQVKTDRRDAEKLARLLRSGDLAPVWVPDAGHEALRDLSRAREAAQHDLQRVRNRVTKLLLRLGQRAPEGAKAWTKRYRAWLEALQLPYAAQRTVLGELRLAVEQAEERVKRLEQELAAEAEASPQANVIAALQCFRGVGLITAVALVAELGDVTRFDRPRQLMGYVGVVSREASSGGHVRRGPITKAGNAHVRYVLVETAWHYRRVPRVGKTLRARQAGQPEAVKAHAWKAQQRLHRRYHRLVQRGKLPQQAVVAVARELLGFVWAAARTVATPSAPLATAV
jgi:transposase